MGKTIVRNFHEITIRVSKDEFERIKEVSNQNGLIPSAYAKQSMILRINKGKD